MFSVLQYKTKNNPKIIQFQVIALFSQELINKHVYREATITFVFSTYPRITPKIIQFQTIALFSGCYKNLCIQYKSMKNSWNNSVPSNCSLFRMLQEPLLSALIQKELLKYSVPSIALFSGCYKNLCLKEERRRMKSVGDSLEGSKF